ncbi:AAA family ATPase (plasmid) [Phyllobacterium sp. A18/5-2]|uniref:bifunctional aminoglycoside phosphotransferase/ATP-binding protein n=1 Tax=Phyllobacterium sp. A18/5-2 TaxID=2978392 RepID=UPI0021C82385|nr:bifunctional aminoglycoside phosphotransferase/ATP-binding protein [Phyllobacterium sp. A18/5-2]UXN66093.1 AAA family ATPase [Phyllobacterium sp. A18/5-2]
MCHDQSETIEFLNRAESYGLEGAVEMLETHISLIFLIADRAFKLKRAVKFPYADFSTSALRISYCLKEIELNRKTAPELYLGVRRITREPGGKLCFDGTNETIDAVVEMKRFPQDRLFDKMAEAGQLEASLMDTTARVIAQFHQKVAPVHANSGSTNIESVLDINQRGFATSHVFSESEVQTFHQMFRTALEVHRRHLDSRETAGMIRRCHGDLHLRNICLTDDGPRLFDCIEFNDQIATVDVLYDLAFLLMDLWHRNLRGHANLVMNRYLDTTNDDDGTALLPFFMALRAAVRAHVTASQTKLNENKSDSLRHLARSYFSLAIDLLEPPSPHLIAIGGLSGSGKSTIAEALAAHAGCAPGARIFESDRVRKAMFGIRPTEKLSDEAYRPEVSDNVYERLCDKAGAVLASQGTVIVDAVFDKPGNRTSIKRVANTLGLPFVGIWLEGEHSMLKSRIAGRKNSVSDATIEVLDVQETKDLGAIRWRHIDAGQSVDAIVELVRNEIEAVSNDDRGADMVNSFDAIKLH